MEQYGQRAKTKLWIVFACLGLLLVLGGALLLFDRARETGGRLIISEAVSSNSMSLRDDRYGSPDWIELHNTSAQPIELAGYTLARVDRMGQQYRFASGSIPPGGYLLVYCCADVPVVGEPMPCTGFKLPKGGTTLVLASPAGSTLQELVVPALETDTAYGLLPDGGYGFFTVPTPGAENTGSYSLELDAIRDSAHTLIINEVLPYAADAAGSWLELYNTGDAEVQLSQYSISDDPSRPGKERLPDMALAPGAYALVYFSDGAEEPRLSFKLNREENTLLLSDATGGRVSELTWDTAVFAGISVGEDTAGGVLYYGTPTPGSENGTPMPGRTEFVMQEGMSDIRINEVLRENTYSLIDRDGDRSPWVELHNAGSAPASLLGYALSDDTLDVWKWPLPDKMLAPGEYCIVFLSGKEVREGEEWHTGFRLGNSDEALLLCHREAGLVQTVPIAQDSRDNISYGMNEAGEWLYFGAPTPGAANEAHGFAALAAVPQGGQSAAVRINEVSAVQKPKSEKNDWVELYNASAQTVELAGWHISDSGAQLMREPLTGSIEPGGFLLCGDTLSLSAAGERMYLSDADGAVVDVFDTGVQYATVSAGRSDESGARVFYTDETPGAPNDSAETFAGYCAAPVFSRMGGFTSGPVSLAITCASEGAVIHYTLDGSAPTAQSRVYTQPIEITRDACVRAIALCDGYRQSEEQAATFYYTKHELPVVCLSMARSELDYVFGSERRQDPRERLGYVEYYEADGRRGTAFPAGFRISGNGTRQYSQRSINLYLRGGYGRSSVTYPFFPGYAQTEFRSLSLRNMGQDWSDTRIRDAYFGMVVNGMNLDHMQARFAAVYINGAYWGMYELKENQNEDQIAQKYGVPADTVQLVRANTVVYNGVGNSRDIKSLFSLATSNMASESTFEQYAARVDEAYFTDYLIAQSFFMNSDAFNQKYMRSVDGTLKWRPLLYDLDWCMMGANPRRTVLKSMFFNTEGVETGQPDEFGVRNVMDMSLYCAFYANAGWRERFVARYAEVLNTILTTERMLALFDEMVGQMRPEMPRCIERWGKPSSMSRWEQEIAALRECIVQRRQYSIAEIKSVFGLSDARIRELFPNG